VIGVLTDDYDVKGQLDLPAFGPNRLLPDYPYMGYHGHDAFFCARGPAVRPAASAAPGTMRDIAPTLLALAGVEPPPFMEGRPFDL
jgi:arylsulfatase A-like enzyme